MEIADIASALTGAQAAQTQLTVAAKMIKMNADSDASVAKLVDAAQQNLNQLANVASGVGGNLDITV